MNNSLCLCLLSALNMLSGYLPAQNTSTPVSQTAFSDGKSNVLNGNGDFRLSATRSDNWDSLQHKWVRADSMRYRYRNSSRFPETIETYRFSGSQWNMLLRENYSYDSKNNNTFLLRQIWAGNLWTDDTRVIYAYDAGNNRLVAQSQSWNGLLWKDLTRSLYEYDANNDRTKWTRQKIQNNAWLNQLRYVYQYDAARRLTAQTTLSWNINEGIWENIQLTTYTYNALNQPVEELIKIWKDGAWAPQLRYISTYGADNRLFDTQKAIWRDASWQLYAKQQYDYDQKGNNIRAAEYNWNGSSWENSTLNECRYDQNNNQVYQRYAMGRSNNWINAQQTFSYYESIVSQTSEAAHEAQFSVIPNLSTGIFQIASDQDDLVQQALVSDLNGHAVAKMDFDAQAPALLDLTHLPDGLYCLRVRTKHGKQGTRQLVKISGR